MSPLLQLPPEIRNRIYDYSIDAGSFHVSFTGRKASFFPIEPFDIFEHLTGPAHGLDRNDVPKHLSSSAQVSFARIHPGRRAILLTGLPLVCRQVYEESGCLWVSRSEFVFTKPLDLIHFANSLSDQQLKAITSVKLTYADLLPLSLCRMPLPELKRFAGLRSLALTVEKETNELGDLVEDEEDLCFMLDILLEVFDQQTPTAVTVRVHSLEYWHRSDLEEIVKEWPDLARDYKIKLLKRTAEAAGGKCEAPCGDV